MKTGFKTSEYWVVLVGQLIAVAVMLGWIDPTQADTVTQAAVQIILAIFALALALAPAVRYISARTELKQFFAELEKKFQA